MRCEKLIIFLTLLSISALCFPKEYAVIANKANPVQEITAKDLKKIFLGEKTSWPDGNQIKLAALGKGDLHSDFVRDVMKMTAVQFSIHWKQKVFTGAGTGTDIEFFKTEEKLKQYISSTPGAIGYIYSDLLDDSIKQITIIKD